jgi:hypothetical protein
MTIVVADAIPAELRRRDQWVVWRLETRDGRTTKVPYTAADPWQKASSTSPATWAPFDAAYDAAFWADGVGYVFAGDDPYTGIDLDGFTEADRSRIVQLLSSYTERSVNGGLHVIVAGALNGAGRHPQDFGVFDRGRYFVVTGDHLDDTPTTIEQRQPELDQFLADYLPRQQPPRQPLPPQPVDLDDEELLERAFASKSGPGLRALYGGDWQGRYGSQSEADLGLCRRLAFWFGRDPLRVDRVFRTSRLYRGKWERDDYRERTIDAAIAGTTDVYSAPGQDTSRPATTSPRTSPRLRPEGRFQTTSSTSPPPLSIGGEGRGQNDLAPDLAPDPDPGRVSWLPIDVVALAARPPEPPEIIDLLYPGYNHLLSGESEALKTWLMNIAASVEMPAGHGVVWVDGDDVGPGALLERLRLLGVDDATTAADFAYFLPDDPLDAAGQASLLRVVRERLCRLAVFDGFNPLLVLHGLDPNSGTDIETFYRLLDPIRKEGVAVVITDNVVKSPDARGGWAIGSERKRSKAEVHLSMKALQPLLRGGVGRAKIVVRKDRPGFLTRPSPGVLVVDAAAGGRCTWRIEPDTSRGEEGSVFRPTALMERVSKFLELVHEPRSRNQIEDGVKGKSDYVRLAVELLCAEAYCEEFEGPRKARMVRLVRIYRAADDPERVDDDQADPEEAEA